MNVQSPEMPDFQADGAEFLDELVDLRREIHQDPELGLENPRTQKRILDALEGLPLEITLGKDLTSVVAVLRGGKPGPNVLLRGDTDGLPVKEQTGLPYAATGETMHACGHDMHTAGLVGAAKILSKHQEELPGNVIFMFQPGEEGYGGAKIMIDEGVLDAAGDRPVGAYAIHVAPGPRGILATRQGSAAAGSNRLKAVIKGRGGHGSQPHLAIDPVPAAADAILAIQAFVTRKMDAFDPVVVSVTQVSTGDNPPNVIPEKVTLGATIRSLTPQSLKRISEGLVNTIKATAEAHECQADVDFQVLYPSTINTFEETEMSIADVRSVLGNHRVHIAPSPMMGSEDFAFVLEEVPGTFFGMFVTPADMAASKAEFNHSPRFVADDSLLGDQAAALAAMAYGRLAREAE